MLNLKESNCGGIPVYRSVRLFVCLPASARVCLPEKALERKVMIFIYSFLQHLSKVEIEERLDSHFEFHIIHKKSNQGHRVKCKNKSTLETLNHPVNASMYAVSDAITK